MSRLTRHRSRVTYVVNPNTLSSTDRHLRAVYSNLLKTRSPIRFTPFVSAGRSVAVDDRAVRRFKREVDGVLVGHQQRRAVPIRFTDREGCSCEQSVSSQDPSSRPTEALLLRTSVITPDVSLPDLLCEVAQFRPGSDGRMIQACAVAPPSFEKSAAPPTF
jgi:hypothetical protein